MYKFYGILVIGTSVEEHMVILDKVPSHLEGAGLRLKRNKCALLSSVKYLGHKISAEGLQPTGEKV